MERARRSPACAEADNWRIAGQSRYARCAYTRCRSALPEAVPVRPASCRNSAIGLATHIAHDHPQHPPAAVRQGLCQGVDRQGLAARLFHHCAGRSAGGSSGYRCACAPCHALWQSVRPRPVGGNEGNRLQSNSHRPALSAIFGRNDGDSAGRRLRSPDEDALASGDPDAACVS